MRYEHNPCNSEIGVDFKSAVLYLIVYVYDDASRELIMHIYNVGIDIKPYKYRLSFQIVSHMGLFLLYHSIIAFCKVVLQA